MPDLGNIGVSMNSLGHNISFTTGYSNLGAVTKVTPDAGVRTGVRVAEATPVDPARRSEPQDRVEVSEHARFMEKLRSMSPIRADKVAQIKSAIEAGTYDSDEKLSAALDLLIQDLTAD